MTLAEAQLLYPGAQTFRFGDNAALCADLLARVRAGTKTATCENAARYQDAPAAMPEPGRQDIALNWNGTPALLIETLSVTITRFCDVDEAFALAEGENDSLAGWRADHEEYFRRTGTFAPDMPLMCERFRVVHDFGG